MDFGWYVVVVNNDPQIRQFLLEGAVYPLLFLDHATLQHFVEQYFLFD